MCVHKSLISYRHYKTEDNGVLTDDKSLSIFDLIGVDVDQETIINTSKVEDSDINQDVPCVITHLDDTHPIVNDQSSHHDDTHPVVNDQSSLNLECDISNTSDNPAMNMDGKMNVTFSIGEYRNIKISNSILINTDNAARSSLDHPRNILQNESTGNNVASILNNQKAEQHNSPSIDLTKHNSLCCKLSLVFIMFCIITCSLMPIVLYYVTQLGEREITDLEYSHARNTSSVKVHRNFTKLIVL